MVNSLYIKIMKKKFSFLMATVLIMIGSCQKYDDTPLRNDVNDLKDRVAALEQWVATANSNISALQGLVTALQNNDYVTGVMPFTAPEPGGYVISFTKSGNVTIFNGSDGQNGTDGKDGANGKDGVDGKDGESPQIAVKKDTDGVYYWTLNGEWIVADGNKLRVTGENGKDGKDGTNPQIRINPDTRMWEASEDNGTTWSPLGVSAGANGSDGNNGITPLLRINSSNIWEVSYDNGDIWIPLGVSATGANGTNPQVRISAEKVWEVSYDNGTEWTSLGVSAAGLNGIDGNDGITPQLRIGSSNIWEVSYNNGSTWIPLGVTATGTDGQDGISPKIRINTDTGEWEISHNDGGTWNPTGIKATGEKGEQGSAVFANNGVNNTNSDYVEFTLADGVTKIQLPKYKELGLDFVQPTAFAVGETKYIPYTAVGNVAVIKFVGVPNGWSVDVNKDESKFKVTAPASFNSSNKRGEAAILISDDVQYTVVRAVNLVADTENGSYDGENSIVIAISGYAGNTVTVYYTDNTADNITKNLDGVFAVPKSGKTIQSIVLEDYTTIYAGRKANGSDISLKLREGHLSLRDPVDGFIPIGTYSEFQLINADATTLSYRYKQDADIDLLKIEWTPIGNSSTPFTGTFDGDSHTVANLKISGNNDYVGLFGYIGSNISYNGSNIQSNNNTNLRNIHIISGSVVGNSSVGGICGYSHSYAASGYSYYSHSTIIACSNKSSVMGNSRVGGICGYSSANYYYYDYGDYFSSSSSSSIIACYNTGSVTMTVTGSSQNHAGGVCGYSYNSSIIACYNTGSVVGTGTGSFDYVGGVCGSFESYSSSSYYYSIIACYNIGSVTGGGSWTGGVCGFIYPSSPIACYWKDIPDDNADYGIRYPQSNTGTSVFGLGVWPAIATHTQWGTGDGSGDGKYWKSLGGWNNGNPVYPKLFFEE
jgi:hypothetical protein